MQGLLLCHRRQRGSSGRMRNGGDRKELPCLLRNHAGERQKGCVGKGFFEVDIDGDIVTPLVPGSEECAYTCFDKDGNCFCAMEKCWFQGQGDFRKPISCWLYPIRVSTLSNGMKALNLHRWDICRDAYEKGKKEKVRVYEFLREPLERFFGNDFYSALCEAARMLTARS